MLAGCQINYYFSSAYNQMKILASRQPIEEALKNPQLGEKEKRKLELAQEARVFAEKKLNLKHTNNYTSYVQLDRPYVTYVVSAAPKWELKHHFWHYPIVGSLPYKGYFSEEAAKKEEKELKSQNLDTYLRGVSAYSTLGWFNDPILSSMTNYSDSDLVNTIIHETVHATIYIKSSADFNERLAVFLGNKGMELFYKEKEGADSPTLKNVVAENFDDKIFSEFMTEELKKLDIWYQEKAHHIQQQSDNKLASSHEVESSPVAPVAIGKSSTEDLETLRQKRLKEIQEKFSREILPKMQSRSYQKFSDLKLNNARLLVYKTYMQDLNDFENLFKKVNENFDLFLQEIKKLETSTDPNLELKKMSSHSTER